MRNLIGLQMGLSVFRLPPECIRRFGSVVYRARTEWGHDLFVCAENAGHCGGRHGDRVTGTLASRSVLRAILFNTGPHDLLVLVAD